MNEVTTVLVRVQSDSKESTLATEKFLHLPGNCLQPDAAKEGGPAAPAPPAGLVCPGAAD